MDQLAPPRRPFPNVLAIVAVILAVVGLFLPRPEGTQVGEERSTLSEIRATGTMRVGFEGYPPYVVQDPTNASVSGYSVELAEAIAGEAGWSVEWIKTSPDTKIVDLKGQRFDVMVEPIFRTIARAKEVTFTRPYASFGYASGIVRKGESRFEKISDVNRAGVVVAVRQGYTDESYAQKNLPAADIKSMKVDDISLVFLEVLAGKADIALADTADVVAFCEQHRDQVAVRFVHPPPAFVPAGFMIRQGDFNFANFLNTSLDYLEANGVLDRLDKKYNVKTWHARPAVE